MLPITRFLPVGSLACLVAGLLAVAAGCPHRPPAQDAAPPASPPATLRLLVIGDPPLAKVVQREWNARSDGVLRLHELTEAEFYQLDQRRLGADVVLYPSPLLGELAARGWIAPLPKDSLYEPAYQQREIHAALRGLGCSWGNEPYAVPLGEPPLLLFYRADLFEKLGLQPPETWEEYAALARQLSDRASIREFLPDPDAAWQAVVEPLHEQWAGLLLLARAAAYSKHRSQFSTLFDYRTMQPLIGGPPFVRALRELQERCQQPAMPADLTPATAVQRLLDGHCAMAIGSLVDGAPVDRAPVDGAPAGGDRAGQPSPAAKRPELGVVPLPGSKQVFNFRSNGWEDREPDESRHVPLLGISGRLGSLPQDCRQTAEALQLLMWLSGPEMGAQISAASPATAPYREQHLAEIGRWTGESGPPAERQQYFEAIRQSLNGTNALVGLRIPGRREYLLVLADAVRAAVARQGSADESLAQVAEAWRKLTESLGVEAQRSAYMRSVGME